MRYGVPLRLEGFDLVRSWRYLLLGSGLSGSLGVQVFDLLLENLELGLRVSALAVGEWRSNWALECALDSVCP